MCKNDMIPNIRHISRLFRALIFHKNDIFHFGQKKAPFVITFIANPTYQKISETDQRMPYRFYSKHDILNTVIEHE